MATFDVTDVLRRTQATGNGSTTAFAFSFRVNATSDVKVYLTSTLQTESTHYAIQDGSSNAGLHANGNGTVVFGTAPGNGVIVTILSDVPLGRTGAYTSGGNITAAALESDFDTVTMALGDAEERRARTLIAPVNDVTTINMTLPDKATRLGGILGFNSSTGNPEMGPTITDVQSLSAVTAAIALLGTSDAVSDMNALSATAVLADMALLGTAAVVEDMGLLATSAVIEDMGLLATSAVIEDMGLLGTSGNVTAMGALGTSANVTAMAALSASAVVADMGILATDAIVADMAILANSSIVDDLAILATSAIVDDMALLATSAVIEDMGLLATSAVIEDMGLLATSAVIEDMGLLATSAVIEDMGLLGTSAVISDMAALAGSGANPNITSVTASGTIAFGSLSDGTITITDIADEDNMSSNSAVKLATQQSIKAYVDGQSTLSLIDEDNMASNSATRPPSQQSTKAYVDATTTIANAALPKAGGAMTGAITTNSTFDGVDIATRDGVLTSTTATAAAALPKAGGTMTGHTLHGDSISARFGASNDLQVFHDGSNSYVDDSGTGDLRLCGDNLGLMNAAHTEFYLYATTNGAVDIKHNNITKISTSANGMTVTGTAVATTDTDTSNTGNVTLDFAANQNFVLTLTGNTTLVNPTTEQVGQSGFITLIQDGTGGRTLSLGTDYETAGGAGITLTATASATDIVPYVVSAAGRILLGAPQLAFS